jgi:hypothetical protein
LVAQKSNGQNSGEWLEIVCRSEGLKAPLGQRPSKSSTNCRRLK